MIAVLQLYRDIFMLINLIVWLLLRPSKALGWFLVPVAVQINHSKHAHRWVFHFCCSVWCFYYRNCLTCVITCARQCAVLPNSCLASLWIWSASNFQLITGVSICYLMTKSFGMQPWPTKKQHDKFRFLYIWSNDRIVPLTIESRKYFPQPEN